MNFWVKIIVSLLSMPQHKYHTIVEPSESGPKEIGVFANVFARGVYQRIDLELGKMHDEYEKKINEYIKF